MNQTETGNLIRKLRQEQGITQLELAEKIGVSDKAVSKWERGRGLPDVEFFPKLADALNVDSEVLLRGELETNSASSGNMKKLNFFVCKKCGNLLFSTDGADISCCGEKLLPLKPQKAEENEKLTLADVGGELYVTSEHEMTREHHISFIAFLDSDILIVKKLYPEWNAEAHFPLVRRGMFLWYCTCHGLMYQYVHSI